MKIGIDISQIVYGTGVSIYTSELVKALVDLDDNNQYILFGGSLRRRAELSKFIDSLGSNKINSKLLPISPKIADFLWNRIHFVNIENFIGKVDLFHTSDWAEPPSKFPKITTVHDLAPVLLPDQTPNTVVEAHKRRLYWVKKESEAIIAPSQSTKDDLIDLGFDKSKIHVIYEALKPSFDKSSQKQIKKTLNKYRIAGKYLLVVGTQPRKNIKNIIDAFDNVKSKLKIKYLVIVGENKNGNNYNRGIVYTGHVPQQSLADLYAGASGLVYASLYEGFGLPILEAFKAQTPVLTSNISSMPEIAQDAAVKVDPFSPDEIADGLVELLKNKEKYITRGTKRLNNFSWKKTAKETLEVYKSIHN